MQRLNGFTLIELITVIILLGILAAVAVPRLPNVTLFQQQFEGRQVVSSLARLRAHAINSQCFVAAEFIDGELRAWIDEDCGLDPSTAIRTFSTPLGFINAADGGGIVSNEILVFTPGGEARTSSDLENVDLTTLADFSTEPDPGRLVLAHTSGRSVQVYDTTGYTRWE